MSDEIVVKLAMGKLPTEDEINYALFEICDRVHASCDDDCPVYKLNGHQVPRCSEEEHYGGCLCFKDGVAMQKFIAEHMSQEGG